jgi:hypothetical protein
LPAAVKSLKQSIEYRNGGDAFEYFFLAMAQQKTGHLDEARKSYGEALAWMEKNASHDTELIQSRIEAANTLGVPLPKELESDPPATANSAGDSAK